MERLVTLPLRLMVQAYCLSFKLDLLTIDVSHCRHDNTDSAEKPAVFGKKARVRENPAKNFALKCRLRCFY